MDSSRDVAGHDRLLSPFRRRGTIACSDSSGLSKASRQWPLIDLMKAVSRPKEVIHAYGAAIGGAAVGIWAASNTEMYYHSGIATGDVIDQMIGGA